MHINRDLYLFSLHYKTAMKQAKIILTFLLSFANEDWVISKVVNKDGDVTIFGDNYTLDGTPIITNHRLDLNNLRRLDAFWTDKGFSIVRNTPTSLDIVAKENSTVSDFNFAVVVEYRNAQFLIHFI